MNNNRNVITKKGKDNLMNTPCTIAETVQIARGVAEDVVSDYHANQSNLQLSISFQIEILKEVVISKGLITEEEFKQKYMDKVKEFQEMQRSRMDIAGDEMPTMKVEAGDIEIKTEE